jgi:predicted ATPase
VAHRIMGHTLVTTGDFKKARAHYDRGIALYNPDEHRSLATQFGQDIRVTILSWRSLALWLLGFPDAALRDADDAVKYGRETAQAASLMFALYMTAIVHILCGNYSVATAQAHELYALGQEKGAVLWKASGTMYEGCVLAVTGTASEEVEMLTAGNVEYRSTGSTVILSWMLSHLAKSYSELGKFDDAWLCISEVMTTTETTNEIWFQADVHRMAGEIALKSPEADAGKAQACFERALAVARKQQAKSWELRAAMSMYEHGTAVARSKQAGLGTKTSRSGLWLVHRRLRHARS